MDKVIEPKWDEFVPDSGRYKNKKSFKFTARDIRQILAMRKSGQSITEIANKFSCSTSTVHYHLSKKASPDDKRTINRPSYKTMVQELKAEIRVLKAVNNKAVWSNQKPKKPWYKRLFGGWL